MADTTIIPHGKVREFLDVVADAPCSVERVLSVEHDAVTLTCHVESIDSSTLLDIKVEAVGDKDTDKLLVAEFPQVVGTVGVSSITVPCSGRLLITTSYTGAVSFQLRGKGVSAAATSAPRHVVINETPYQQTTDNEVLAELKCIRLALDRMVNHLREITGIETDRGDEY